MIKIKIITIIVVLISFFILSYKLTSSFIFHPDFARDMFDITRISQGKLMLIGPKLTFGGIYSGPYYYYLFVPILLLSQYNIDAVLFFNTFLFSLSLGFFFYKVSTKQSFLASILATSAFLFSPLFLIASRNPSNAFTYIPFLLILMTIIYFDDIQKPKQIFFLGIFAGIIATFHLVSISALFFISMLFLYKLKRKEYYFLYVGSFVASFAPLLLFEIKHNFVMFKNTFIDKSYLMWIKNSNIPGGITGKKNPIENFFFIAKTMEKFLIINPLILLGISTFKVHSKLIDRDKKDLLLLFSSIASLIFLALFMRFQFIYHYLFATIALILFSTIVVLAKNKLYVILFIFIALELVFIPKEIYLKTWREAKTYENAVNIAIQNHLISKSESFNIIQVTNPDLLSPNGFEYRYFLQKRGFAPDSEFIYKTSRKLILFSEKPEYDIKELDTWESREFGREYLSKAKKYKSGKITIYVTNK